MRLAEPASVMNTVIVTRSLRPEPPVALMELSSASKIAAFEIHCRRPGPDRRARASSHLQSNCTRKGALLGVDIGRIAFFWLKAAAAAASIAAAKLTEARRVHMRMNFCLKDAEPAQRVASALSTRRALAFLRV